MPKTFLKLLLNKRFSPKARVEEQMEATRTKEMTILAEIIVKKSKTLFLIY